MTIKTIEYKIKDKERRIRTFPYTQMRKALQLINNIGAEYIGMEESGDWIFYHFEVRTI